MVSEEGAVLLRYDCLVHSVRVASGSLCEAGRYVRAMGFDCRVRRAVLYHAVCCVHKETEAPAEEEGKRIGT